MQIDLIFKVAAIGIIVAVLGQLLIRSGRRNEPCSPPGRADRGADDHRPADRPAV